ncbi:unnamed protein product [Vicia faba]|uniref:Reverse transcriptase Ty1/copia-type domain-containing protein n=1 Tax=Vicia faba TaxID=3906 RepID=A0AAV1BAC9_VICFA|nr:unnamed protein product [Vicia faba]
MVSKRHSVFSLNDLGQLDYFLGIEVKNRDNGSMSHSQGKYIRDLLTKTNMLESKPLSSPMEVGLKLSKNGFDTLYDQPMYRSVVGALLYITITRPSICFIVNKVCRFMAIIAWWAKKQPDISCSSTETEYRSLALATSELLWIQSLLQEFGIS